MGIRSLLRPLFLKLLTPNLQIVISPSFLNQISSHKAHFSSFSILIHFNWLKSSENTSNGKIIQEVKVSSTSAAATGTRHHGATGAPPTPIPPSLSSSTLFSSDEQRLRYSSLFSSRQILDPKYLDLEFFDGEVFDCFQAFQNSELIHFMSLKLPHYPELVRVFYSNLEI